MPPRRERKVITVLFADLVGFTSRAEHMDPEDVAAELARYQARLRAELDRFGGTVEKFIGDAVMAVFGVPVTHEDDPERAVRAALAICHWAAADDVQVRVGISTGEALVMLEARPQAGETMVAGDAVNIAARLQVGAPVNGVLVTEATYRATSAVISYEHVDAVVAKGKDRPVRAWRPMHTASHAGVERAHGAKLVGRARDLELLLGSLDRARAECTPQLVSLIGVPGIGKSRLALELFERIEREREFTNWRRGRCLPYGDGITFWALGEMVKAQASILDGDSAEEAEAKLRVAVDEPWVESHLRPLVGLAGSPDGGSDRRAEAFAAWRRFFEGLAEKRPLVLLFEDLHWADDSLLDFIDYLVEWTGPVPMLVVCTARPELLSKRPGWGGGKPNTLTISLSPLSDEDMSRLLTELVDDSVVADTRARLLERAGGNPLYAEEYSRMFIERGGTHELPETVQGVIAARLDLLEPELKAVVQDASVVGRQFWVGALTALGAGSELEDRLHALQRSEFVRREPVPTVVGEAEYSFRHVLMRDVAYAQIPRAERADRHRLVAEWIETLGRREDYAEMLAHHYSQSIDLAAAAGVNTVDYADAARRALSDAGDRAMALNSVERAAGYYRRALDLLPPIDPLRGQLLLSLGRALLNGDAPDDQILKSALAELMSAGDTEAAADAETQLAILYGFQGERDLCYTHLDNARRLVMPLPTSRVKAVTISNASRFMMRAANDQEAIRLGRQALDMAQQLGLDDIQAAALNNIGTARVNSGDDDGLDDLNQAIEVAQRSNSIYELCRAKGNLAARLWTHGELHTALGLWRDAEETADTHGQVTFSRWLHAIQFKAYTTGEWDEALDRATTLIEEVVAGSPHYLVSQAYAVRALVRLARETTGAATNDIEQALAAVRRTKDPQSLYSCLAIASHLFFETGDIERAASNADEYVAGLRDGVLMGSAIEESVKVATVLTQIGRATDMRDALASSRGTWPAAAAAVAAGDHVAGADICSAIGARAEESYLRLVAARAGDHDQLDAVLAFYRDVKATRYTREAEILLSPPD